MARTCAPAIEAARSNPSAVGGEQALDVVEVDRGVRRAHVDVSVCEAISAATRPTTVVDVFGGAALDVQPQQRLGVGGPQVEPAAVAQIDRHPVEMVDGMDAVAERLQHRLHARCESATVKLISPEDS